MLYLEHISKTFLSAILPFWKRQNGKPKAKKDFLS
jgi:hypothetical protein